MRILPLVLSIVIALTAASCGSSSASTAPQPPAGGSDVIRGILVVHPSSSNDAHPVPGVLIGLYPRPVSQGGPVQTEPPDPLVTVKTGPDGTFRFTGLHGRPRYFVAVAAMGPYTAGHWARPGGAPVRLVGCTDCPVPL